MKDNFYSLIPAGGSGTRMWPVSRKDNPKFFHDLTGEGKTLLISTIERLGKVSRPENVYILASELNRDKIMLHLENSYFQDNEALIGEPAGKNSMPAIALACAILEEKNKDSGKEIIIGSFAADHLISNHEQFVQNIESCIEIANKDYLVTLSITPTKPATGYGYIKIGDEIGQDLDKKDKGYIVDSFIEKPDYETAKTFYESGEYAWNAGIFIGKTKVILELLKQNYPELHDQVRTIAKSWFTDKRNEVLQEVWKDIKPISIDNAIAEPASKKGYIATVKSTFDWEDIGDYESLYKHLLANGQRDDAKNVFVANKETKLVQKDSENCLVFLKEGKSDKKVIALLGIKNVFVIETDDSIFIADKDKAQEAKDIVDKLDSYLQ